MKLVDGNEFKSEIKSGITVVDFFANWCAPCKMLAPILDQLSNEMKGKVKFIKVDIDQSSDLVNEFQIASVPTTIVFKEGKKEGQFVGFLPKEKIQKAIESILEVK